jgi:hypothetical protein
MERKIISVFILLILFNISQSYVTADGKAVPPLPSLTGGETSVSSASQLAVQFSSLSPGKTIVLEAGTYLMSGREPFPIDEDNVTIRGSTGDPNDVVIVGRGFESCTDVDEEMFMLYARNFTIADLTISESRCHGIKFQGGNNDHTIIHNIRFLNIGERMIKAPGTTDAQACSIRYCHFEDTKIPASNRCGQHDNGDYIAGMDLMYADDWVIHDNYFKNIRGAHGGGRGAIFIWNNCTNMISERNTFVTCDRSICYGNPSGGTAVTGGIIRNNFIVKGPYIAIEMEHSSNIKIYNNTVYATDTDYSRTIFFMENQSGNEFKNNIVFGRLNLHSGTMPDTASNLWQNSFLTNWFENINSKDLHLTSNATAAIDRGLSLSEVKLDWDGHERSQADNYCDIGADEYNSGTRIRFLHEYNKGYMDIITAIPNPFSTSVDIKCSVGNWEWGMGNVSFGIYDISGRLVYSQLPTPNSQLGWDGRDNTGRPVPNGNYMVYLEAENQISAARIILLR